MNAREIIRGRGKRAVVPIPPHVSDAWGDMLSRPSTNFLYREPYVISGIRNRVLRVLFSLVERWIGPLKTRERSLFLTPQWKRLLHYLVEKGFAEKMILSLPHQHEPPRYNFFLFSPFHEQLTDGEKPRVLGLGRGFSSDYDTAVSTAFGECLERVPFLYYRNTDLLVATSEELGARGEKFLDPRVVDAYDARQRRLHPKRGEVSERTPLRWVKAHKLGPSPELSADETTLVPAQLVYWKYKRMEEEPELFPMSTHGGAGYFTKEGALLRALYEWIGRDGFFGYWLRGIAPPRIDPRSIVDNETRNLISLVEDFGLSIHLLDITPSDIAVPSVFCVLTSETSPVAKITGGSGSDVDLQKAIRSAIEEALSMHHWLSIEGRSCTLPPDYNALTTPLTDVERLSWWAAQPISTLDFFLKGPLEDFEIAFQRYPLFAGDEERGFFDQVMHKLVDAGHEVFAYISPHPVPRSLGFHSVRVFVTHLLPMYHGSTKIPLKLLEQRFRAPHNVFLNTLPSLFP